MQQTITLLGATGTIGVNTLKVIDRHPEQFKIFALSGHRQFHRLAQQCIRYQPSYAVVLDNKIGAQLSALLVDGNCPTEVLVGAQALCDVASDPSVDSVMAAIVGSAGLRSTMAAVRSGKKVLLANKESLVMAGTLFMQAVVDSEAILLPIDSEHNAIFQCLPTYYSSDHRGGVSKLLLSASGGPFRGWELAHMASVTPEQACAHPKWEMGQKISVDSATLMNKGLEVIEAGWLFAMSPENIDVVVHPQSIIHSLVQYLDGSVLAQLGYPDMRTPIAHALAWPERIESGVENLDLVALSQLDFEAPDQSNFPCLQIAYSAAKIGGDAPAVLNAANEIAVQAFLDRRIGFTEIASVVDNTLLAYKFNEPESLAAVEEADMIARGMAMARVKRIER
ncbi:MAG: 1-deoxy-D-xylulose-5-phosphate reductoisomerase [Porticoccaceae bacterium]|nr:1-deoxy-D-xylulose-5-phosphate reductoisomerase [Porticoccaceae bacterium]